jgi:hypothetical protein
MKRALWIGLIAVALLLIAAVGFLARLVSRPAGGVDTRTRRHMPPASRSRAAGASLR